MTIGILGLGFVGGAVCKYFERKKTRVYKYDKYKQFGSIPEINLAKLVFICVPTPYHSKKRFDSSFVYNAIGILKGPKIVVIKSSVVPGTTEALQKKYPQHKFLFNPEFLREANAEYDFAHPPRQIVGFTKRSKTIANKVLKLLPKAPYEKIMPSREAELVKYMANGFLALKVVYGNQFYDLCRLLKIDYNIVQEALGQDPRIGNSHFIAMHAGYRGYGGSCLPKDVNSIIQLADQKSVNLALLKTAREVNRKLLKISGLDEKYFLTGKHKKVL